MFTRVLLLWIFVFSGTVSLVFGCAQYPAKNYTPLEIMQDTLADGSKGPLLVVIPAGSFIMGPATNEPKKFPAEQPSHRVTIDEPFAIGQFELTFEDYDRYVAATGAEKPSDKGWGTRYWGRIKTPVFNVSWHDAQRYLEWLSEQTGQHYRLPSEAEWEYAARAGTTTAFHTGDCINTDQANYHGQYEFGDCPVSTLYRGKVIDVGSFAPNAWGLHDVHGNIFEWTLDCWHTNYQGAPDNGSAWMNEGDNVNCDRRVLRGGSWSGRPLDLRSGGRSYNEASFKSIFIGFRVVREL